MQDMNDIITRDLISLAEQCESELRHLRALMLTQPDSAFWELWFEEVEKLEQRSAKYRATANRRGL